MPGSREAPIWVPRTFMGTAPRARTLHSGKSVIVDQASAPSNETNFRDPRKAVASSERQCGQVCSKK